MRRLVPEPAFRRFNHMVTHQGVVAVMIMFLFQGMAFMILVAAQTPVTIFLASAWVGLNFGGIFALFPSATADYFGTRNLGVNYGWVFTAYAVAGIVGPMIGGSMFKRYHNYTIAFYTAAILAAVRPGLAGKLQRVHRPRHHSIFVLLQLRVDRLRSVEHAGIGREHALVDGPRHAIPHRHILCLPGAL